MARPKKNIHRSGGPVIVAQVFLFAAACISIYLASRSWTGGAIAGCGPGSGCDRALNSQWAYWLGLPVSVPAALVYASLLITTFVMRSDSRSGAVWFQQTLCALIIGGAAWFIFLQFVVLDSLCPFCLITHLCAITASILLWQPSPKPLSPGAKSWIQSRPHAAGYAMVAALLAGQFVLQKSGRQEIRSEAAMNNPAPSAPEQPRYIELHDGMFRLDLGEVPLRGNPASTNLAVVLFDYTCHYCRDLHHELDRALQLYTNQLAFVSLPMPLDASCNHLLERTRGPHQNACEYALLGLAVWRAAPEKFAEFDTWMFAPSTPPPLTEARRRAEELVGAPKLQETLQDPWIHEQLQTGIKIYEANHKKLGNGQMPQMIVSGAINMGVFDSTAELFTFLETHLPLSPPPL